MNARESKNQAALIAAYREGLGLAAIVIVHDPAEFRVEAVAQGNKGLPAANNIAASWWCRRAADAARVAAAATVALKRRQSRDGASDPGAAAFPCGANDFSHALSPAADAIAAAAKRLGIALYSDDDVCTEAAAIIARVEQELERLRGTDELKSVNRSYRTLRTEAAARGEKVAPYAQWLNTYKADLVRQLAAALRYA